ncbi:MAG: hypothetical protein L6406_25360 [Desulfobacterales bacterium]|nr:hypothetical protein [Desulfobacterales bacterium]
MELRKYLSSIGQWPPHWCAFYSECDNLASDEKPEKLKSVEASKDEKAIRIIAEYEGNDFSAVITIEDLNIWSKTFKLLDKNIGIKIKEIGSLDI